MIDKHAYVQMESGEIFLMHTLRDGLLFVETSFIKNPLGNGVVLIVARLLADPQGAHVPQAIQFDKAIWTVDDAKRWLMDHKDSFSKKDYVAELHEVPKVQIFEVGTWNGDVYSIEDLDLMVDAFNQNKEKFKPFLKLGHDKDQELIQRDGLPAAGWIGNIYRDGKKLFADFVDVPKKIFELIQNKAFRKVSAEIYWNVKIAGQLYKRMLSAVALLGTNHPAVESLDDILALYDMSDFEAIRSYVDSEKEVIMKTYQFSNEPNGGKMEKTEREIKLELDLGASTKSHTELELKLVEATDQIGEQEKKLDGLNAELNVTTEKILKQQEEARQLQLGKSVDSFETENLATPSMKPFIRALLDNEKKEYSIEEKAYSKEELLKEVLKLHAASDVNMEENSVEGDGSSKSEDAQEKKIQEYMRENDVGYTEAYKEVMRTIPDDTGDAE